jgi:hypothetical protein
MHSDEGATSNANRARRLHIPDLIWAPLAAGSLILIPGLLGLAFHQPWLFPSLGPTAFLQAELPHLPSSRPYNIVVGHLIGLGAGLLAVTALGAADAPPVLSSEDLTPVRVAACVLAVLLTMTGKVLFKASHPPAAATTLIIALGGMKASAYEAGTICMSVFIVALAGEAVRRLRLRYLPGRNG